MSTEQCFLRLDTNRDFLQLTTEEIATDVFLFWGNGGGHFNATLHDRSTPSVSQARYSQSSDQMSCWCAGWYMHRNRPIPRHIFGSICQPKSLLLALLLFSGVCQCFDFLARPFLSVSFHCCEFARRMPQTTPQTLPAHVQGELFLCLFFAPFWEVDLQRLWSPTIAALTRLMPSALAFVLLPTLITAAN